VTKDKTKDAADKTKKAPEIEGLTYEIYNGSDLRRRNSMYTIIRRI